MASQSGRSSDLESANPPENTAQAHTSPTDNEDQTSSTRSKLAASHDAVMDQKQPVKPPKCTFSGVVPIELKRFLDSGLRLVECPDCACTRTLKPQGRVLRFKSHDKRKTRTPNTDQQWARCETVWGVVGGEQVTPILATKLYLPRLRANVVNRHRLLDRLNEGLHCKLTLISAPAGFGKTTLVSEWLAGCGRPAAVRRAEELDLF
jgi:hypothetical protein